LAPVADRCEQLDWAVDLYQGPISFPYFDEDHPENVLSYHRTEGYDAYGGRTMHWFERGFLPRHADRLIMDEWSSYLGFDSRTVSAAELAQRLEAELSPRPALFKAVARLNLLYLFRVDTGWWEAYTGDGELLERLRRGWAGVHVSSDRWNSRPAQHPLDDAGAT
jgi:hypothetical protein